MDKFEDMGLKDSVLKAIKDQGLITPSPIQKLSILPVLHGHDVLVEAQSGGGKTKSFIISTLNMVDTASKEI